MTLSSRFSSLLRSPQLPNQGQLPSAVSSPEHEKLGKAVSYRGRLLAKFALASSFAAVFLLVHPRRREGDKVLEGFMIPRITSRHLVNCQSYVPSEERSDRLYVRTKSAVPYLMNVHDTKRDTVISKQIHDEGCFECATYGAFLSKLARASKEDPGSTFLLDIGANLGIYSLAAAALGLRAYAFEPFRENWLRICNSIHVNFGFDDKVSLFNTALSHDGPRPVHFDSSFGANLGGMSISVGRNNTESDQNKTEGKDYAWGIKLDSLQASLPTHGHVALKVDVEGSECDALSGGLEYLSQIPISLAMVEWSMDRLQKCRNREEIFHLFEKNGLRPFLRLEQSASGKAYKWRELNTKDWKSWRRDCCCGCDKGLFDTLWSRTLPE